MFVLAAGLAADVAPPLTVIRALPGPDADPGSTITIAFDRPVAGSLDRSIDPRTVLTLDPVMQGTFEWRDPVTLRFRPASPMPAGLRVRVTVQPGFPAMDGTTLAQPYQFEFRVRGPRVLAGLPAGHDTPGRFLPADARFRIDSIASEKRISLLANGRDRGRAALAPRRWRVTGSSSARLPIPRCSVASSTWR